MLIPFIPRAEVGGLSLIGCLLLGAAAELVAVEAPPPNVVLIVADDLGWRDLGAQGSTFYESPRLDALAAGGVRFTQAYAACQVCSPSRASLVPGPYPARVGITDWIGAASGEAWKRNTALLPAAYRWGLPHERVTVAEAFQDAGYATFFAGKWHLGETEEEWPEFHGFEINQGGHNRGTPPGGYFSPYRNPRLEDGPPGEHLPLRLGRETADFVTAQAATGRPFFAMLSFYSVHGPAQTTQARWAKFRAKAAALPEPVTRFGEERRRPIREVQDNPVYGGMIEAMDEAVGTVLDALAAAGVAENTVVIFTSDNGGVASGDHWATSNRPLRGGKGYQWEGGLRVPFIVSWPGQVAPRVDEATLISGIDVYPTLLELAALPARPAEHVDGRSLAVTLRTGAAAPERTLIWHYPHYGNQGGDPSAVVRRGDWKLVHTFEDGRDELYRLGEDPMETTDVAAEYPALTAELREALTAFWTEVGAQFPVTNPHHDAAAQAQAREREMSAGRAKLETDAAAMLAPDWVPPGGWWETREADAPAPGH